MMESFEAVTEAMEQTEASSTSTELPDDSGVRFDLPDEPSPDPQQADLPNDTGDALQIPEDAEAADEKEQTELSSNNNYEIQSQKDALDLSNSECTALMQYTLNDSQDINESLYNKNYSPPSPERASEVKDCAQTISACLDRKEIRQDCTLYRGIDDASIVLGADLPSDLDAASLDKIVDQLNQTLAGKVWTNDGFTSASFSPDIAKRFTVNFGDIKDGKIPSLLVIKVPEGAKGMCMGDVSFYGNSEQEVLLQKATSFRIDSIRYVKNADTPTTGIIMIEVSAIGCSPDGGNDDEG